MVGLVVDKEGEVRRNGFVVNEEVQQLEEEDEEEHQEEK